MFKIKIDEECTTTAYYKTKSSFTIYVNYTNKDTLSILQIAFFVQLQTALNDLLFFLVFTNKCSNENQLQMKLADI